MKKQIKKLFGIEERLSEEWSILDPLAYTHDKQTVLDLGCYNGFFMREWLKVCPNAVVHAFEPAPESFAKLNESYGSHPRAKLINSGVGAEAGEIAFNTSTEKGYFNSFLDIDSKALEKTLFSVDDMRKVTVPVTTLDGYVSEQQMEAIHLIKVDVQGYELNVLKGSTEKTLGITDHWLIESGVERLYHGAPRFTDIIDFMMDHGYHIMAFRAYHLGNNVQVETDILFRRNGLEPPNPVPAVKIYSQIG